ncbi:hypothetical protein Ocin01_07604 [Orchesella cincta]|uniref:Uncharacterized protein n=1 Tax=Orchesella cincta TaxID=48709 RepID=A0A1D2N2E5_ORCCI|nr:hypothetical protein Ocin01_07604 [Orchesella cincta]
MYPEGNIFTNFRNWNNEVITAARIISKTEEIWVSYKEEIIKESIKLKLELTKNRGLGYERFKQVFDPLPMTEQREDFMRFFGAWAIKFDAFFLRVVQVITDLKEFDRVRESSDGIRSTLKDLQLMKYADIKKKRVNCEKDLEKILQLKSIMNGLQAKWKELEKSLDEEIEGIVKRTSDAGTESRN